MLSHIGMKSIIPVGNESQMRLSLAALSLFLCLGPSCQPVCSTIEPPGEVSVEWNGGSVRDAPLALRAVPTADGFDLLDANGVRASVAARSGDAVPAFPENVLVFGTSEGGDFVRVLDENGELLFEGGTTVSSGRVFNGTTSFAVERDLTESCVVGEEKRFPTETIVNIGAGGVLSPGERTTVEGLVVTVHEGYFWMRPAPLCLPGTADCSDDVPGSGLFTRISIIRSP